MPASSLPPARPDPEWYWVNVVALLVALGVEIAALFVAIRYSDLHVRLCAISAMVLAHVAFVWLCCLLARARGYHPAWGLIGVTVLGAFVLPFLPSDVDDQSPLEARGLRGPYWVGLRHVGALVILWGMVLGAFWNSFESKWVLDNLYIIKLDPRTQADDWKSGLNTIADPGVVEYFQQDYWWPKGISGLYRPLTSLTYWVNWTVFGGKEDPTGMHVVNMVLHWLNAALVYALAWGLTRRWAIAIVAGLIFAVHPISTESVTNIIGRADQFAALAVLGGVLVWRWAAGLSSWQAVLGFACVMLITAFGVFAKESSIALGLVILIYDVVYRWHPTVAKWFGMLVLLALVPLIGAGSFDAQHPWWAQMGKSMRVVVALVCVAAGIGTHVYLTRAMPGKRIGAILLSLVFCVLASAFVPAAGLALFGLVVIYEALAGPWLMDAFPAFARIKWPAALYTAGFCAFVFVPLAFGAGLWFKAGADAKHSDPIHSLIGTLNVLGGSCPPSLPVPRELGGGERLLRAGAIVMIGVLVWVFFTSGRRRTRVAALLLIGAVPLIALAPLLRSHEFEFDATEVRGPIDSIHVIGSFNDWSARATPMTLDASDAAHSASSTPPAPGNRKRIYRANVRLAPGVYHYKFLLNGVQRVHDVASDRDLEETDGQGGFNAAVRIGWPDFWWQLAVAGVALVVAGAVSVLPQPETPPTRRLAIALPIVLLTAMLASLYVFWAGFALTFAVGLLELMRGSAAPRVLRESALWNEIVRRFIVGYYLLLPPVIAMFFVRYWIFNIQSTPPETPFLDNPLRGGPFDPLPFWQSRMTAIKVMGKLIYLLIWPVPLSSDYSWDQIPFFLDSRAPFVWENIKAVIALLVVVGAIVLAVRSYRRGNKALSFFILFFFAAILPTSNLPVLIGSIMAERFLYLPLIGFAGVAAIGLVMLFDAAWRWLDARQLVRVRPPFRAATGAALVTCLAGAYACRAYIRNFDWMTDLTLWEAALVQSPRAFRCYQSLAFAHFERNQRGAVDRMIKIAGQARPIVDPLAHDRNSSRLYLHLGMYYNIKGDTLSAPDGRGGIYVTPEARAWHEKAVEVLERGVLVDRTFNRVNRRKQLERGDRPDRIYDSGLTPVYYTLGQAYQRLGMGREAVNAYNYMRQLEPEAPDAYNRIAIAQIEMGKPDEAAVAVIQSMLLDQQRRDQWQTLAQIYSLYGERGRGALLSSAEGPRLNVDHPIVRDHFINAYRGFIRIFRYANRPQLAEAARQVAVYRYRLPPSLFDSLMLEPIPQVTPQGLDYSQTTPRVAAGK